MVLSAADHWTLKDGTKRPTGFWAEEFAVPYTLFRDTGWRVTIATPGGKKATPDKASLGVLGGAPKKRMALRAKLAELSPLLARPVDLASVDHSEYDLVFYPGGHAPMEDLATDAVSGSIITERMAHGRPLAMLCHSPAAAFAAKTPDGTWPFVARRMTGFSDLEERLNTLASKAKWTVESRLRDQGAEYSKAKLPLMPHIVVDGNLYTGQNPASSKPLAQRIIADLG